MCAGMMQPEPRKVALLIGNNNYTKSPLTNCVNDADDLSAKLKQVGFVVTKSTNLNYEGMDRAIESFAGSLKPGDFVLFFFAGHGTQWEDQNYLIPCDDNCIKTPTDLRYRAMNAQRALELMSDKKPFVIVYLLDCCRTYWLPSMARDRAMSSRGLAPMQALGGSMIAFACAPGKTAGDTASNGRNGVFTYHLLQHITRPGENLQLLMTDVTDGVANETSDLQVPYTTSAVRSRDIYIVPPTIQESTPKPSIKSKPSKNEEFAAPGTYKEHVCKGRPCARCGKCRDWYYTGDAATLVWMRGVTNWNIENYNRWNHDRFDKHFQPRTGFKCGYADDPNHYRNGGYPGHPCFCEDNVHN